MDRLNRFMNGKRPPTPLSVPPLGTRAPRGHYTAPLLSRSTTGEFNSPPPSGAFTALAASAGCQERAGGGETVGPDSRPEGCAERLGGGGEQHAATARASRTFGLKN
eukprot:1179683-Prorocentrum_minimum.AAC.2